MNIEEVINKYLEYFPKEKEQLKQLSKFIKEEKDIFDSRNTKGHITASGYIYNKKEKSLLLLEHKKANLLLQPGGHSEKEDNSTLDTAIREIYEETRLKDLAVLSPDKKVIIPIDINTHFIQENKMKNMPSHYHHDFRYLFIVDEEKDIKIDINESNDYKWIKVEEIKNIDRFKSIVKKIENILDN